MSEQHIVILTTVLLILVRNKAVCEEVQKYPIGDGVNGCVNKKESSHPVKGPTEDSSELIISYEDRILLHNLKSTTNRVLYQTENESIKGAASDNSALYISFGGNIVRQLEETEGWKMTELSFVKDVQIYELHWDHYSEQLYGLIIYKESWRVARLFVSKRTMSIYPKSFFSRPSHFEVDSIRGYVYYSVSFSDGDNRGLFRFDPYTTEKEEVISQNTETHYNTFFYDAAQSQIFLPGNGSYFVIISMPDSRFSQVKFADHHRIGKAKQLFIYEHKVFWGSGKYIHCFSYDSSSASTEKHIQIDFHQWKSNIVSLHLHKNRKKKKIHVAPPQNLQVLTADDQAIITWSDRVFSESKWRHLLFYVKVNGSLVYNWFKNSSEQRVVVNGLIPQSTYNFQILREGYEASSQWSCNMAGRTFSSGFGAKSLLVAFKNNISKFNLTGSLLTQIKTVRGPVSQVDLLENTVFYLDSHSQLVMSSIEKTEGTGRDEVRAMSVSYFCVEPKSHQIFTFSRDKQLIEAARVDDRPGNWRAVVQDIVGEVTGMMLDSRSAILYWTTNMEIWCVYLSGSSPSVVFRQVQEEIVGASIYSDTLYWLVKDNATTILKSHELLSDLPASPWKKQNIQSTTIRPNTAFSQDPKYFFILEDRMLYISQDAVLVIYDLRTRAVATVDLATSSHHVTSFSLIDSRRLTTTNTSVQYIPEPVQADQVRLTQSGAENNSSVYTITWSNTATKPTADLHCVLQYKDLVMKSKSNSVTFVENLPAFSDVTVAIYCETRWCRSAVTRVTMKTAQKPPSPPTNIRTFSQPSAHSAKYQKQTVRVRWSPPNHPRGMVHGYKVAVFDMRGNLIRTSRTRHLEHLPKCAGEVIMDDLTIANQYYVQVRAVNGAGEGGESPPHRFSVGANPLVRVLLLMRGEQQKVLVVDHDSGEQRELMISKNITDVTVDSGRQQVYLLCSNSEIWRYDLHTSRLTMIFRNSAKTWHISFDWIGEYIYFSQQGPPVELYRRWVLDASGDSEKISIGPNFNNPTSIFVSPIARLVVWTERTAMGTRIYRWSMDSLSEGQLFLPNTNDRCNCKSSFLNAAVLGVDNGGMKVLLDENLVETDLNGCNCSTLHRFKGVSGLKVISSAEEVYWTRYNNGVTELVSVRSDSISTGNSVYEESAVVIANESMRVENGWVIDQNLQPLPSQACLPQEVNSITIRCITSESAQVEFSIENHQQTGCPIPLESFPVLVQVTTSAEGSHQERKTEFHSLSGIPLTNLKENTSYSISVKIYSRLSGTRNPEARSFQATFSTTASGWLKFGPTAPSIDGGLVVWKPACREAVGRVLYILQTAPYTSGTHTHAWKTEYEGHDTKWKIASNLSNIIFRLGIVYNESWTEYSASSEAYIPVKVAPLLTDTSSNLVAVSTTSIFVIILILATSIVLYWKSKCSTFPKCDVRRKYQDDIYKRQLTAYCQSAETSGTDSIRLTQLSTFPASLMHATNGLYQSFCSEATFLGTLPKLPRRRLIVNDFLGRGAFGQVFEGRALFGSTDNDQQDEWCRIAVKTLTEGSSESEKVAFVKEAWLMSSFSHPHVLSPLGVCLDGEPYCLLMELMECGDLLSFLRNHRNHVDDGFGQFTLADQIQTVQDIACGCSYLEEKHFVHRDLAARNCLVTRANLTADRRLRVKIGDFGLTRDVYDNDYYRKTGEGPLPIRWMSPEALIDGVFTSKSDVWAFGVLIWEVLSNGEQPYPGHSNTDVINYVRVGGTPSKPEDLHKQHCHFTGLMQQCWCFDPEARITFAECVTVLSRMKQACVGGGIAETTTVHNAQYSVVRPDLNFTANSEPRRNSAGPSVDITAQIQNDNKGQTDCASSATIQSNKKARISRRAEQTEHSPVVNRPVQYCGIRLTDRASIDLDNVHFSF